MIERVARPIQQPVSPAAQRARQGAGFGGLLQQELQKTAPAQDVAFSKLAITRAEERGIEITPSLMDQIRGSMVRAQAKGATNILAMDS